MDKTAHSNDRPGLPSELSSVELHTRRDALNAKQNANADNNTHNKKGTNINHTNDQQISDYKKAYEEEFRRSNAQVAEASDHIREIFVVNSERVAQGIVAMAIHGKSDAARFNASKYIVDKVEELNEGSEGNPLQNLLSRLQTQATQDLNPNNDLTDFDLEGVLAENPNSD